MKRCLKLMLLSVFLSLITVAAVLASVKTGYAKIADVEGNVIVKRRGGNKKFKAVKGMRLAEGDSLLTDKTGNVTLVLEDNSQIVMGKNTRLTLSGMKKPEKRSLAVKLDLKKGTIFSNIKRKLKKRETFKIKAVNIVAGVRGTKFYVHTDGKTSNVQVDEGKVKMQTLLTKKSLMVEKGELASAVKQQAPYLVTLDEERKRIMEDIDDDFFDDNEAEEYDYDDLKEEEPEWEEIEEKDGEKDNDKDDKKEADSQDDNEEDSE